MTEKSTNLKTLLKNKISDKKIELEFIINILEEKLNSKERIVQLLKKFI